MSVAEQGSIINGQNVRLVRMRHPHTGEMGYFATPEKMGTLSCLVRDHVRPTVYVRTDPVWNLDLKQTKDGDVEDIDEATVLGLFPRDAVERAVEAVAKYHSKSHYIGSQP